MIQSLIKFFNFRQRQETDTIYSPFSSSTKRLVELQVAHLQRKKLALAPRNSQSTQPLAITTTYPAKSISMVDAKKSGMRLFDIDRMDKIAIWVGAYFGVKPKTVKLGTQNFSSDTIFVGFTGDQLMPTKSPYAVLFPIDQEETRKRTKIIAAKKKAGKVSGCVKLTQDATCLVATLSDDTIAVLAPYKYLVGHKKTLAISTAQQPDITSHLKRAR